MRTVTFVYLFVAVNFHNILSQWPIYSLTIGVLIRSIQTINCIFILVQVYFFFTL